MERIAIVSDTHLPRGSRRLPEDCVRLMAESDAIVHAGDLSTVAVLEQLLSLGPPVFAVHGNADEPELRRRLPASMELALGTARIGLTHNGGPAKGRLERLRARFPECAAVVFGHSHIPLHEQRDGFQIFNPGSATDRRRQPQHTIGLARIRADGVAFELISLGR
ncbi:MAG: metallophosphoesterase family protein [Solirubrobacteraceae bacterium]